jgi:hypothetical protein
MLLARRSLETKLEARRGAVQYRDTRRSKRFAICAYGPSDAMVVTFSCVDDSQLLVC